MRPALRTVLRVAICLCFFASGYNAFSQQDGAKVPLIQQQSLSFNSSRIATASLTNARIVRFNASDIKFLNNRENTSSRSFDWTIDNDIKWSLVLKKTTLTTAGLPVTTTDARAEAPVFPELYTGTAREGKGQVRLAINDDFIYGFVDDGTDRYFIEPLKKFDNNATADQYLVYNAKSVTPIENFCGTPDLPAASSARNEPVSITARQSCTQFRVAVATDYAVYKRYGSVQTVLNYILGNWNIVQSFYTGFDLDKESATDEGDDDINFLITSLFISTDKNNDVLYDNGLTIKQFIGWADDHFAAPYDIAELVTGRQIPAPVAVAGIANLPDFCTGRLTHLLEDYLSNAYISSLIQAHETGHNMGCFHDNEIHSSVRFFVMNAGAIENVTRFSVNRDFPAGYKTSSKYYVEDKFTKANCVPGTACTVNTCTNVQGLQAKPVSTSSVKLQWQGTAAEYIVQYKLSSDSGYKQSNTVVVTANEVTLNLQECSKYHIAVKSKCDAASESAAVIIPYQTSEFVIDSVLVQNIRNRRYDLQFVLRYINGKANAITVEASAGNSKKVFPFSGASQKVTIPGVFHDGRQIQYLQIKANGFTDCHALVSYKAPPYTDAQCQTLLSADFNGCALPTGWTNIATRRIIASSLSIGLNNITRNSSASDFAYGNIDSTCMIFYDYNNNGILSQLGAFELKSPVVDISNKANVTLSFDYIYFKTPNRNPASLAHLKVEVFDGSSWVKVFMIDSSAQYTNYATKENFWKSIPPRVVINVDRYRSPQFQVRFILDDGTRTSQSLLNGMWTGAFDNISLCGSDVCNWSDNKQLPAQTKTIHHKTGEWYCTDSSYFTHYTSEGDSLLLSLKKSVTDSLELYPAQVSLNFFSTKATVDASKAPYVKAGDRWVLFNKYWHITPGIQSSDSVTVRLYFTQAELEEMARVIGAPANADIVKPYYLLTNTAAFATPVHQFVSKNEIVFPYTQITKKNNYYVVEFAAKAPLIAGLGASLQDADPIIQLTGIVKEEKISLQWKVMDEAGIVKYTVEHSTDGTAFTAIATANSTGVANYSYDDVQPSLGINYYRIRAVDAQGRYKFSRIVLLRYVRGTVKTIFVYPIPVKDNLQLEVNARQTGTISIEVLNATGQLVWQQIQPVAQGFNRKTLQLQQLAGGIYLLRCRFNDTIEYTRFIKL